MSHRAMLFGIMITLLPFQVRAVEVGVQVGAVIPYAGQICVKQEYLQMVWDTQHTSYNDAQKVTERLFSEPDETSGTPKCFNTILALFTVRGLGPETNLKGPVTTIRCRQAMLQPLGMDALVFTALCAMEGAQI